MELLEKEEDGSFIVRESSSQPGNFALTMRGNDLMHHFIIRKVRCCGTLAIVQSPLRHVGTAVWVSMYAW